MYFNDSIDDVISKFNTNPDTGLTSSQVEEIRSKYGSNKLASKKKKTKVQLFFAQLNDILIYILIVAAILSVVVGKEISDAIIIGIVILVNATVGMIQESKAEKALDALKELSTPKAIVKRNGELVEIPSEEVVPGDVIIIDAGRFIPCDIRLIESANLKIEESALTGESVPVDKNASLILEDEKVSLGDKKNMAFMSTLATYGRATGIAVATGMNTEIGKIAKMLDEGENELTPLQKKLEQLGKVLGIVAIGICAIMFAVGLLQGRGVTDMFMISISLAVAAIPEGLAAIVTIVLALGVQRMIKQNAIIRKLPSVETLGSVNIICSDKTGTLTQNRMTVEVAYIDGRYVEDKIESNSYFLENCTINSTADIEINEDETKYLGSATECALLLRNKDVDYRKMRNEAIIIAQNQFSSNLKRMSTIITENNKYVLLTKGAPEIVLELCKYVQEPDGIKELTKERKEKILSEIAKLQEKSMRALGFAYKEMSLYDESQEAAVALEEEEISIEKCEESLVFGGFVGIRDPLRPDVKHAVDTAHHAGVSVKMLTGDNINTARAIGEDLGLLKNNMRAVEASYIDTLTDEELREEIKTISIVARSKPDSKMRIVQALQADGEVVAVTGDGINDAPALSKADVGIAMGISGTEVSKNAADIILTDDSFSTIVSGIKWGRGIYDNFQRFVQFQLTVNIIAFLVAIISQVVGQEMPFTTIQLLWVNIIMDGPPALALGLEPVRKHVLDRKPVNRNASIITKSMIFTIIGNALYITLILMLQSSTNILNVPEAKGETVMFGIFAFSALFNAFNCREFNFDSIIPNLTKNKLALQIIGITAVAQIFFTQIFRDFFNAVPLSVMEWIKIIALSFTVIIVDEVVKFVFRLFKKENKNDENMPKVEA